MSTIADQPPIARLRDAVFADGAAFERLARAETFDAFLPEALAFARGVGISIDATDLRRALTYDPLGLARHYGGPPTADRPPAGWLPIHIAPMNPEPCIDWVHFGARPLGEPFFEDSIRGAMCRPINRLARFRTRLADLPACAEQFEGLDVAGFIFHMSRCGSTLVTQMLAADPAHVAISEAAPLDAVLRFDAEDHAQAHDDLIRAMVKTLTQRRATGHARAFIKFDSWHARFIPRLRRLYPDVPWIFLYREPQEVMVSQAIARGVQTLPEVVPPQHFGLSEDDLWPSDVYLGRVLARTCEAVFAPLAQGGGMLVNYRELPDAMWTRILPHFGVAVDDDARARMHEVTRFNAKFPGERYAPRVDVERDHLTDELRAIARDEIGPVYRRLEAARAQGRP